ncbi:MAG: glycosyltransferase family 39 protein [Anaerolineae bacterium]|nr:glycosyltransferase family 39 protein [Anaerolineae bacterium]
MDTPPEIIGETLPDENLPANPPQSIERNIEDLTLAELVSIFFRAPRETLTALTTTLQRTEALPSEVVVPALLPVRPIPRRAERSATVPLTPEERSQLQIELMQLGLRIVAFLVALYGSGILTRERVEQFGLDVGIPYLLTGFLIWFFAEFLGAAPKIKKWLDGESVGQSTAADVIEDETPALQTIGGRLLMLGGGLLFSLLTLGFTADNRFRLEGLITWFLSIGFITSALAPSNWSLQAGWAAVRGIRIKPGYTLYILIVVMVLGAYLRLANLDSNPPEMTSDHVEKILDSQSILDGQPQVFFPNNGGREPIQFYLMAFLSQLPGLGMNFFTLKFLSVLEGLITIPIMWWLGRAMIGDDEPELGNVVGLALAALVAVSYWHVALSRLGLRIVLTTLFTALIIIFFSRALRYGRRGDFIKTGLALGFGLYAYQAMRIVPAVIIAGIVLAAVFQTLRYFIGRQPEWGLQKLIFNTAVLVGISLVVFVPLLGFSIQHPNDFWRRTQGRLLGDDIILTTDEAGNPVERQATLQERIDAFNQNVPILMSNIRNALLMYNWKGDVAWINAAPNRPAMDPLTSALLIVGLAAWLARMLLRRDVADWLMPIMLFLMLLPSALSIAYPIENPSATRASGSLPEAYLFAALPLGMMVVSIHRVTRAQWGRVAALGVAGLIVMLAFIANRNTYFDDYSQSYLISSPAPYSEAGDFLRGFAESGGSAGNAFMIAYPYWWDHRAVGIEAGLLDWPNGIVTRDDVPRFLYDASQRTDRYMLDPAKDLLFFYSVSDIDTDSQLREWFPNGYGQRVTSYKPGDDFTIYRVPALGFEGLINFAVQSGAAG